MSEASVLELKPPPTIREALVAKYAWPHYVTMFEVRDSTGFDSSRSADALSIGMYRSRGRELTGFEIKTARSDWLRELKQPEKAEEIGKFCEWFYLVTSDDTVARIDELPTPWGWMVLKGEKLKVLKKPQQMKPVPLDRHMLCSLLYSLHGKCFADIEKQIEQQVEERTRQRHSAMAFRAEEGERKFRDLESKVRKFEDASGVNISSAWVDLPKVGDAVRRIVKGDDVLKEYKRDLTWVANHARNLVEKVDRELADILKSEGASA